MRKSSKHRKLTLESLDVRTLLAGDVFQESEPNNSETTANRFEMPAVGSVRLSGISQSKDDKDYFAFTAPASGPVSLVATSSGAAKVEVKTSSGMQVLETEPKHGLNGGKWQAVAGQTYWLRVRAPEKVAVNYEVALSTDDSQQTGTGGGTQSEGPEVEPNDRPSNSTRTLLTTGAELILSGSASKRDRDFFTVRAEAAGTVSIDTGDSGIKVSVETVSGIKLFESEPRDAVTTGSFVVTAGQDVIVRARGSEDDVTPYHLQLQLDVGSVSTSDGSSASQPDTTVNPPLAWFDCSDDGLVSALDALLVINHINSAGHSQGVDDALVTLDTNDDRSVSALDALLVINHINQSGHGEGDQPEPFDDSDIRKLNRRG